MKKRILLFFLLLAPFLGKSSHIVGGEFELIHIQGFQYRLNMILYFDSINGQVGTLPQAALPVAVRIFRKVDNIGMMDIVIPYISRTMVKYTQPACSDGSIVTLRLYYTVLITLSPSIFNDPGGYYVSWERCCRNYGIMNVISVNPDAFPGTLDYAGQTFYLEFPPVVKDGQPFVDSTPRLFPPLNDYGCPHRSYYTDFGGTDDDGDSLVYSLTTPLNTQTAAAVPPGGWPRPGPYSVVKYRPPFSSTNIMAGTPDLRISRDGFLTVTPSLQGLFVFAVKVEEFRNKIKIGETRRDFQMLVVDKCPKAVPPQILGKGPGDASFVWDNNMSVFFPNTTTDGQRCIKVQVSDPDSQSSDDGFLEQVKIKAFAMNFKKDLSGILPTVTNATLINGSTVEFTICFPQCPFFFGGTPQIGIIAMDDACTLPLSDTLRVNLTVQPPANRPPYFTSTNPVNAPLGTLNEGSQGAWPWIAKDDDGDPLSISLLSNGFTLASAGMTFNTFSNTNGAANGELKWDAYCNIYDFTKRTSFQVTVIVEDQDFCAIPNPAKAIYNLNVILPGNADPTIDTDLTPAVRERRVTGLTRRIDESLGFTVTGKDQTDNDYLVLSAKGKNFNLADYGVTLVPSPATGNGLVTSTFNWDIKCDKINLKNKETFDFQFIVVDNANKCRFYKADTVDVEVTILPPINHAPQLSIANASAATTLLSSSNNIDMILGKSIDLLLTATDSDVIPAKDNLKLELSQKTGNVDPEGYSFTGVLGKSPLQAAFTWNPDCTIFKDGVFENEYAFTFRLKDDHCITAKSDSLTLHIKIKDVDGSDKNFVPPNFFSPNGDDVNDYFAMEVKDPSTGELKNILPNDNCDSRFEAIRIYNRWGKEVFLSSERNFKWYGVGESAGIYYYFLKFSKREYRGSISLRY